MPRRLAPALPSESSPLENADVAVSLDRQSREPDGGGRFHLVVQNCGRGTARDIDVALLPVDQADQAEPEPEPRPTQRIRLSALDQGERHTVPVTALPGPVVTATWRWSDEFADYERHRLLKAV